jgi:transcriptional regulator with XRE-family HTH domain
MGRFTDVTRPCHPVKGLQPGEVAISTTEGDAGPLVRALGARVRRLRRARGLTLARLAALAGLSHPFLSKLERGLASPSMASLAQIARALGTSQLELLAGADPDDDTDPAPVRPPTEIVRAGDGVAGPYGLGHARLLVGPGRRLQPMEYEGDNLDPGDYFAHAEDEFLHVTHGTVIVDLADHGTATLARGDSVYVGGGVPHRWCAAEPGGYRLFIVKERPLPG